MTPPDIAPKPGSSVPYWLAALAALLALTWFFDGLLEERYEPNRDAVARVSTDGARELVLRQDVNGHYVVNGTINGAPAIFLLDTGATTVSVPARLAEQAQLRPGGPRQVGTANGTITVFDTHIERLELGGMVLENLSASINPQMEEDAVLLGMSALRELQLTQVDRTLTIRVPTDQPNTTE